MQGLTPNGKSKAEIASESIYNLVMTMQSFNIGSSRTRYLMNVAKFGDQVTEIAKAQPPGDIKLKHLAFRGDSGWTVMAAALDWASAATEESLTICRQLPVYDEAASPRPLVVFVTDGGNTGLDITETANRLHSIQFKNGAVRVVACGIGLNPEHSSILCAIASAAEDAVNIKPSQLEQFIAAVGATAMKPEVDRIREFAVQPASIHSESVPNWDLQHCIGLKALNKFLWADAERALTAAHAMVQSAGDHRLAQTLVSLTTLHTRQGNWAKALPFGKESLSLLSKVGSKAVLEPGVKAGVELAELLELSNEKDHAKHLWINLAGIWESSAASGLAESSGKLAAIGFRDFYAGRLDSARHAFEKVKSNGGLAAKAAIKGLEQISIYVAPAPEPQRAPPVEPPPNWELQHSIGLDALNRHQWAEAEQSLTAAHSMVRSAGDHRLASTLVSLTALHTQQGNWAKALPFCKQALSLVPHVAPIDVLERGLNAGVELAELLEISSQKDHARPLWTSLADIWQSFDASGLAESNGKLAAVGFRHLYEGRFAAAKGALEKVKSNGGLGAKAASLGLDRIPAPAYEPDPEPPKPVPEPNWDLQLSIGNQALNERNWTAAEQAFTVALSMVRSAGDYRLADTWIALTRLHTQQGDWRKALPFGKDALDLLVKLGSTTALESGLKSGVELAELLEIANETKEAEHLWKKIASIWESPAASGLAEGNGKLAAAAFRDLHKEQYAEAKSLLQRVRSGGGLGTMAAHKGLAQIEEETSSRLAAEPDMELLLEEVVKRFGVAHSLSQSVIATLRGWYALGGRPDKIAWLNHKYRTE